MVLRYKKELVHTGDARGHFFCRIIANVLKSVILAPGIEPSSRERPDNVLKLVAVPQQHEKLAITGVHKNARVGFVGLRKVEALHAGFVCDATVHAARVQLDGGLSAHHHVLANVVKLVGCRRHSLHRGSDVSDVALHGLNVVGHVDSPWVSALLAARQVLSIRSIAHYVECIGKKKSL